MSFQAKVTITRGTTHPVTLHMQSPGDTWTETTFTADEARRLGTWLLQAADTVRRQETNR